LGFVTVDVCSTGCFVDFGCFFFFFLQCKIGKFIAQAKPNTINACGISSLACE